MTGVTVSKQIAVSPERVFAALTDLRNLADRVSGIVRVEVLTDGEVRSGSRYRETRVMFKREATAEMVIAAFEPPTHYAMTCEESGCRYVTDTRIVPEEGGCRVEIRFEAEPIGFMARVMCKLMGRAMIGSCRKAIEGDLEDIRLHCEEPAPEASPVPHPA